MGLCGCMEHRIQVGINTVWNTHWSQWQLESTQLECFFLFQTLSPKEYLYVSSSFSLILPPSLPSSLSIALSLSLFLCLSLLLCICLSCDRGHSLRHNDRETENCCDFNKGSTHSKQWLAPLCRHVNPHGLHVEHQLQICILRRESMSKIPLLSRSQELSTGRCLCDATQAHR